MRNRFLPRRCPLVPGICRRIKAPLPRASNCNWTPLLPFRDRFGGGGFAQRRRAAEGEEAWGLILDFGLGGLASSRAGVSRRGAEPRRARRRGEDCCAEARKTTGACLAVFLAFGVTD